VLFPTSFGYFDPHILKVAPHYPTIQFLHCGGLYQDGKHPKNVGSYFGYIDESQYIAGIVAGGMSKSGKLGFVAAKPISQVLRNINNYTLGARSIKPNTTVHVIFTGDWSLPVREAEATNSLVDQGIDVVTCHVDSPKVVILIFAGATTEVCVQTSMREANDRGYECLLIEDGTESYFPSFKQATVCMIQSQGGIVGWVTTAERLMDSLRQTYG
jgi:basic membrane lipoprotein Med (substrate-binding protein (PBP1-ABC) superfamily)